VQSFCSQSGPPTFEEFLSDLRLNPETFVVTSRAESATAAPEQTEPLPMETTMEPAPADKTATVRGKRTTSVRLDNLDEHESVVRDFGFKDRSHFFQLCADALLQVHHGGQRLDWPPKFVVRE
jgi:hypothetical protein